MAVRFTAAGQSYSSSSSVPGTGAFTITCWVNQIADINQVGIWGIAGTDPQSFNAATLDLWSGSTGLVLKVSGTGGNLGAFTTTRNAWYKLAVSATGSGSATFYHADATSALTSDTGSIGTLFTASTLRLGSTGDNVDWFSGRIAAFKQWSVALTAAEIQQELSQHMPSRTTNLVRCHPFVSAQTTDYSGFARTLSGGSGASTEAGPPIAWAASSHRQFIKPWTPPITAVASPPFRRASRGALLQF